MTKYMRISDARDKFLELYLRRRRKFNPHKLFRYSLRQALEFNSKYI